MGVTWGSHGGHTAYPRGVERDGELQRLEGGAGALEQVGVAAVGVDVGGVRALERRAALEVVEGAVEHL
eukprot:7142831-Prymnesium_polylepis.1